MMDVIVGREDESVTVMPHDLASGNTTDRQGERLVGARKKLLVLLT
jgi:hypothetical protein